MTVTSAEKLQYTKCEPNVEHRLWFEVLAERHGRME